MIGEIERASLYGQKLHVANPVCEDDVFTDRWPEAISQQNEFAAYLRGLVSGLESVRRGDLFADRLMDWLRDGFGDRVVTKAADRMADEVGSTIQSAEQKYSRRGGILLPTAGIVAATAVNPAVAAARSHTFFGVKI
jgi:hypothetical protein